MKHTEICVNILKIELYEVFSMILELALSMLLFAQEPQNDKTYTMVESNSVSSPPQSALPVLRVEENKITWSQYCKMVEKEAQDKLGADFVVAFRPSQKPKFPVKLGGHFDLEKQVFIIDVLVDDPEKK